MFHGETSGAVSLGLDQLTVRCQQTCKRNLNGVCGPGRHVRIEPEIRIFQPSVRKWPLTSLEQTGPPGEGRRDGQGRLTPEP